MAGLLTNYLTDIMTQKNLNIAHFNSERNDFDFQNNK